MRKQSMDELVDRFRCGYYQLTPVRFFSLGPWRSLSPDDCIKWQETLLHDILLAPALPVPVSYRLSVVKYLLKQLGPDVAIEGLYEVYASFSSSSSSLALPSPSPSASLDSSSWVHSAAPLIHARQDLPSENIIGRQCTLFAPPAPSEAVDVRYFYTPHAHITLHETPGLIAASATTGHKTWEAALALGTYLLQHPHVVRGKTVLELGAGTGFLAILAARMGAVRVTATDGNEGIVQQLQRNVHENQVFNLVDTKVLRFGELHPRDDDGGNGPGDAAYDVVLGADVTYDETVVDALAATIAHLVQLNAKVVVIIAATVRREQT